jgi:hypothetical protein
MELLQRQGDKLEENKEHAQANNSCNMAKKNTYLLSTIIISSPLHAEQQKLACIKVIINTHSNFNMLYIITKSFYNKRNTKQF